MQLRGSSLTDIVCVQSGCVLCACMRHTVATGVCPLCRIILWILFFSVRSVMLSQHDLQLILVAFVFGLVHTETPPPLIRLRMRNVPLPWKRADS